MDQKLLYVRQSGKSPYHILIFPVLIIKNVMGNGTFANKTFANRTFANRTFANGESPRMYWRNYSGLSPIGESHIGENLIGEIPESHVMEFR
jgi:hypothetical protein